VGGWVGGWEGGREGEGGGGVGGGESERGASMRDEREHQPVAANTSPAEGGGWGSERVISPHGAARSNAGWAGPKP
jgi:hypothetical protein